MPSLFKNAIASIRMGVEDFRLQDHDRDISSVRNFYAGVLLLVKEALMRAAPNADPQYVIGAKFKPMPDGQGGIVPLQVGNSTIDFQHIGERAKDFGITLDHVALGALNKIRNDIEHRHTSEPAAAVRAAISKGFAVVASLFRQMNEDPLELLGEAWTTMLETKELYDQELMEALGTMAKIEWYSPSISAKTIKCGNCQSELVEQIEHNNKSQNVAELRCRTCGQGVQMADAIEQAIEAVYGGEVDMRYRDASEYGPIYTCPSCDREALVEGEDSCASCGESLDYPSECGRCGTGIGIQDYLDGLDDGLCSYCAYICEKVMRED